jgi:hypothetical protein
MSSSSDSSFDSNDEIFLDFLNTNQSGGKHGLISDYDLITSLNNNYNLFNYNTLSSDEDEKDEVDVVRQYGGKFDPVTPEEEVGVDSKHAPGDIVIHVNTNGSQFEYPSHESRQEPRKDIVADVPAEASNDTIPVIDQIPATMPSVQKSTPELQVKEEPVKIVEAVDEPQENVQSMVVSTVDATNGSQKDNILKPEEEPVKIVEAVDKQDQDVEAVDKQDQDVEAVDKQDQDVEAVDKQDQDVEAVDKQDQDVEGSSHPEVEQHDNVLKQEETPHVDDVDNVDVSQYSATTEEVSTIPSSDIKTYTIMKGTVLYYGSMTTSTFDPNNIQLSDNHSVAFFSPDLRFSLDYINSCIDYPNKSGYIHMFKVKKDIDKIVILSNYEIGKNWNLEYIEKEYCSGKKDKYGILINGVVLFNRRFDDKTEKISYVPEFAICRPNDYLEYETTRSCVARRDLGQSYNFDQTF